MRKGGDKKRGGKLNALELYMFCSRLRLFLYAGIPLVRSLTLLSCEVSGRRVKKAVGALTEAVFSDRKSLSGAMEESGRFPGHLIRMIGAGEASGKLDGVLESMSRYYKRERRLRERVKSAVIYPLLMIVMMCVVVFFIITRVLPMFRDILTGLGGELPGSLLALIKAGVFFENHWIAAIAVILLLVLAYLTAGRTAKGRYFLDRCKAALPLGRKLAAARFAGAMSFLLSGGVPMDSALDIGRDILNNKYMAGRLNESRKEMRGGETVAGVLEKAGIFPRDFTEMFAAGFVSGEADTAMEELAELYEEETDHMLEQLTDSVEPALSAVLSVIVGLILVMAILPLIRIMSLIG